MDNSFEHGFQVIKINGFPYLVALAIKEGDERGVSFEPFTGCFSIWHTHPEGSYEMFFAGDIKTLYDLATTYIPLSTPPPKMGPHLVTLFMVVDVYTYAITVDDIDKLSKIATIYSNKREKKKFLKDFKNAYQEIDSRPQDASQSDLAEVFLNIIETKGFGISLYRANNDDIKNNPNIIQEEQDANWKQLVLDENNNLTPIDCN